MNVEKIFSSKLSLISFIVLPVIVLDQLTKQLIHRNFAYHESVEIIPGFFNLTYVRNSGAAWGIFSDTASSIRTPFFWAISIIAIIGISVYLYFLPAKKRLSIATFSLILSGATGNFLDRVGLFHRGGYVIDFLDFYLNRWHWPAFNVADSAISVSIGLLVILAISEEREKRKQKAKR